MSSWRDTAHELAEEGVATAGAMRAVEEPAELVLSETEEDSYEMGLCYGMAATLQVLQQRGWLPRH
jgi:hypothetical protein